MKKKATNKEKNKLVFVYKRKDQYGVHYGASDNEVFYNHPLVLVKKEIDQVLLNNLRLLAFKRIKLIKKEQDLIKSFLSYSVRRVKK